MAPKTPAQWYDDGLSLLDSGFFESANQCFDQVLSIDPQHAEAWMLKAIALTGLTRYEEAIESFDRALDIEPDNEPARKGKSLCLAALARQEEIARQRQEQERLAQSAEVPAPSQKQVASRLYSVADGLVVDAVQAMTADEKEAWFVYGQYGGVTRLTLREEELRTYTTADGLVSDAARCVVLSGNAVWFGTDRGLSRFDREAEEWTSYSRKGGLKAEMINDLAVQGGFLWMGTDSGLVVFDTATGRSAVCPGGPEPPLVDCVLIDGNRIWCAVNQKEGGLSVFDSRGEVFQRIDVPPRVQGLALYPLGTDQKLWVATKEALATVDRGTFEVEEIPLTGMVLTDIAAGVENLLVSTASGVATVDLPGEGQAGPVVVNRSEVAEGQYVRALCATRTREWMAIHGQGVLCLTYGVTLDNRF